MKTVAIVTGCTALLLGLACSREARVAADVAPSQPQGTLRTITLPEDKYELPPGLGRETAQAYCIICHTPRYVANQPGFSKEVWLAEVTKMRKVYSAPIPEDQVPAIVDYLVAVRGVPVK